LKRRKQTKLKEIEEGKRNYCLGNEKIGMDALEKQSNGRD